MTPRKKRTMTPDKWTRIYKEKRRLYENFSVKLSELITELLRTRDISVAQIEHRTKTVESFKEKLQREGKSYDDPLVQMTDLSGIRIIAYNLEDVEKIGQMLKSEFEVDEANSIDKAQAADPDRFGYASVHYVVSLSASREKLTEWKPYTDIKAEVQVRTVLQHAWAVIDHKLRYKAAHEVPRSLRRQLFRLSALLELADSEFSDLTVRSEKLNKQYSKDVRKGEYDMELNLVSLAAYLKSSKQHLKWNKIAREVGYEKTVPEEFLSEQRRLLKLLRKSGIQTINDFNSLLNEAENWGRDILEFVFKGSREEGFVPFAVPHDILTILTIYGRRKSITSSTIKDTNFRDELRKAIMGVAEIEDDESS